MELETKRLSLIPMTVDDLDQFHATNTNQFVKEYLWDDETIHESLSREILAEVEQYFQNEKWGLWKIINLETRNYLGYAGFWHFFDEDQPQLIFALLPENTGKGYATESGLKLIEYAFKVLNFNFLIASTDKPNLSSVNTCLKLEMELVEEKEIEGRPTLFFRIDKSTN